MNANEKLKVCLKDLRRRLQGKLNECRAEKINILRRQNAQKAKNASTQHNFQVSHDSVSSANQSWEETNYDGIALSLEYALVEKKVILINNIITVLNTIINNYSTSRAVKFISLPTLLETLSYAYGIGVLTIEDVRNIFGLTVEAGRRFLSKSKDNCLSSAEYSITLLQDYFESDGNFRYNERVERFKNEISRLEADKDSFKTMLHEILGISYEEKSLADELTELLEENNRSLEAEKKDSSTLVIKKVISEIERVLNKYSDPNVYQDSMWVTVSSSFDHEKAVKPLDISVFLYTMTVCTVITDVPPRDIAACLGMLVHKDFQNRNNTRLYFERCPREVKQLLGYFNEDGTFKENPRVKDFENILRDILTKTFKCQSAMVIPEALNLMPRELRVLLEESNEKFRVMHAAERRSIKEAAAREKISEYYANGCVIEIPFLLDEFLTNLHECGFTDEEEATIKRHIDNRIQMRGYRVGLILNEEELQLYLDSKNLIKVLANDSEDLNRLSEALKNLSTIADLLSYEISSEERAYLEAEKRELLENMKTIVTKYSASSVGEASPIVSSVEGKKAMVMLPQK